MKRQDLASDQHTGSGADCWLRANGRCDTGCALEARQAGYRRIKDEETSSSRAPNCNKRRSTKEKGNLQLPREYLVAKTAAGNSQQPAASEKITEEYRHRRRQQQQENEKDVDSGYAWIILAVMFIINASTFGTARAYGLIFEKLVRQTGESRANAALPFTVMGAIENMGGPLTSYLLARTRSWRLTVFVGSCLITLSHLLAAFCEPIACRILSMGLMCGLGLSLITISSFQINNAYFVRYRSRAFGLGLTGAVFGTFYISPLCEYVLNKYGISECYLILGLILFPNVPLSLMLKPKEPSCEAERSICTVSEQVERASSTKAAAAPLWHGCKLVIKNPMFHLIWPTQLLFCWFNFVFGMIIVDFGRDRGLDDTQLSRLIPIWAFGQLAGRIVLGSLVDMRLISYRHFTVICFASISLATFAINDYRLQDVLFISLLAFVLSAFISNLYLLFNGLVVRYMDEQHAALSIGISSFAGSFFLLPRANIIGYYRDTTGNYDQMLTMFTYISMLAAFIWLLVPELCDWLRNSVANRPTHYLSESLASSSQSLGEPDCANPGELCRHACASQALYCEAPELCHAH